jgi:phage repressor protein C with HTH and peptisase S24 domain
MKSTWDRIDAELKRRAKTWAWLGRQIDASDQAMHNWKRRGVPPKEHAAIANALQWSVDQLLAEKVPGPSKDPLVSGVARDMSHGRRYALSTSRVEVPVTMTIRPTAAGEIDVESEQPGGTVESPAAGPRAFALRIAGDALYPALRHGMFVVCDPDAECTPGEPVLLEHADGMRQIRELVFDRGGEVTTISLVGGHRDTVARSKLRDMVAIVGTVYPSRWRGAPPAAE